MTNSVCQVKIMLQKNFTKISTYQSCLQYTYGEEFLERRVRCGIRDVGKSIVCRQLGILRENCATCGEVASELMEGARSVSRLEEREGREGGKDTKCWCETGGKKKRFRCKMEGEYESLEHDKNTKLAR